MNKTKRILMSERIERAVNDKLAKKETKTYCRNCGHFQIITITNNESKVVACERCAALILAKNN